MLCSVIVNVPLALGLLVLLLRSTRPRQFQVLKNAERIWERGRIRALGSWFDKEHNAVVSTGVSNVRLRVYTAALTIYNIHKVGHQNEKSKGLAVENSCFLTTAYRWTLFSNLRLFCIYSFNNSPNDSPKTFRIHAKSRHFHGNFSTMPAPCTLRAFKWRHR